MKSFVYTFIYSRILYTYFIVHRFFFFDKNCEKFLILYAKRITFSEMFSKKENVFVPMSQDDERMIYIFRSKKRSIWSGLSRMNLRGSL